MPSVHAQLKELRQKVAALQVEVSGRRHISSMVVWDQQNEPSVNSIYDDFSGLVVHLTPDLSPLEGTRISQSSSNETAGVSHNEFKAIKQQIVRSLDSSTA